MTKYTLILAPLEVFAKRTFLGQGPETAALPDPEQMNAVAHWSWMRCAAALGIIPGETYREPQASSGKRQAASCKKDLTYINI